MRSPFSLALPAIVSGSLLVTFAPDLLGQAIDDVMPLPAHVEARASASASESAVTRFLEEKRAHGGFPGACAAWVGRDGVCHAVAVGFADMETKTPMRVSDRMLSGSIGKTYVATVALQLVVEKKLDLDAKVESYLGDRVWFGRLPNARDITVRSLMNHTSGLPRYVFERAFLRALAADRDRVWKPEELLAFLFDHAPAFAVGKGWAYADTNYIVLGVIIEKLEGRPYYQVLQRRVLDRFGLRDTIPSDRRRIPGLVQGYTGSGRMFGMGDRTLVDGVFAINPQFEWCGGGLACTTADLARWAAIHGAAAHWPDAIRRQFLAGVPARLGRDARYGLGVIVWPTRHGEALGHSGFMPGYVSEMRFYTSRGLAVAIQCNTDRAKELAGGVGRWLDDMVDRIAGSAPADPKKPSAPVSDPERGK